MNVPDLSHLTKEEQQQILAVIKRQQDEEQKEKAMIKNLNEQFENYKENVRKASENATQQEKVSPTKTAGNVGEVCLLCHKTKIANGCGHTCSYCQLLFCSRCGGRVPLKSNKNEVMIMWVCNLCRKQQDILTKTGTWYHGNQKDQPGLTLNLEPVSATDKASMGNNMKGSVSLAVMESDHLSRSPGKLTPKQAAKLKKENSEPQLSMTEQVNSTPELIKKPKVAENSSPVETKDAQESDHSSSNSKLRGVRRSSTNSERRLYRQEQAIVPQVHEHIIEAQESPPMSRLESSFNRETTPTNSVSYGGKCSHSSERSNKFKIMQESLNREGKISTNLNQTEESRDYNKNYDSSSYSNPSPQIKKKMDSNEKTNAAYDYVSGHSEVKPAATNGRKLLPVEDKHTLHKGNRSRSNMNLNHSHSNTPEPRPSDVGYKNYDSYRDNAGNNLGSAERNYQELFETNRARSPHVAPNNYRSSPVEGKRTRHRSTYDLSDPGENYDQRLDRKYIKNRQAGSLSDTEGGNYVPISHRQQHSEVGASRRRIKQKHYSGDVLDYSSMQELSNHQSASPLKNNYEQENQNMMSHPDKMASRRGRKYMYDSRKRGGYKGSYDNLAHQERYMDRSHRQRRMNASSQALDALHYRKHHPHVHGREVMKYIRRNPSLSSTDEEFQSNLDYSSCEDNEPRQRVYPAIEKKSQQLSGGHAAFFTFSSPWHKDLNRVSENDIKKEEMASQDQSAKKVQFTRSTTLDSDAKKKKTSNDANNTKPTTLANHLLIGANSLPDTRDSGFDTGSSINTIHSEDTLKDQQPVSWQASKNGKFLIGRMMLNKNGDNLPQQEIGVLGLKVVGGKVTESGRLGAFITQVKPGSVADAVGRLRPGDEVIMWNRHCFQDATFNEVYDCVLESKHKQFIELMVSRPIKDLTQMSDQEPNVTESSSSSFDSQKQNGKGMYRPHKYSSSSQLYSPRSRQSQVANGSVQIKLWYDEVTKQLYVTTLQAVKLPSRPGGQARNPYMKMYLLPDRSEASKRRTKTAKKTLNPVWNQSFVYGQIRPRDLESFSLEISLWDLDRSVETNNHFLGKVFIELGAANFDSQPYWFDLQPGNQEYQPAGRLAGTYSPRGKPISTSSSPLRGGSKSISHQEFAAIPTNRHFRESVDYQRSNQLSNSTSSNLHKGDLPQKGESSNYLPQSYNQNEGPRYKSGDEQYNDISNSSSFVGGNYYKEENHKSFNNQNNFHRHGNHSKETALPNKKTNSPTRYNDAQHSSKPQSPTEVVQPRSRAVSVDDTKGSATLAAKTNKNSMEVISKSMSLGRNLHTRHKAKEGRHAGHSNSPRNRKSNTIANKLTSKMGVKSHSSCQLENNGKKGASARTSEYGVAHELTREGSKDSSGSLPSLASEASSCVDKTLQDFVGSLGPGQAVGRQTLAANSLGDLELGLYERQGVLEVQVIRGRNLIPKSSSKVLPATYAKVYLMFGLQCVAKKKTKIARRTLDPSFHQTITFDPSQYGNAIQVIVWGDYGRLDHKAFMGVVQVKLENLDLSTNSIGWYRLFPTTSIVDATSLTMNQQGSMTSLESDANTFKS